MNNVREHPTFARLCKRAELSGHRVELHAGDRHSRGQVDWRDLETIRVVDIADKILYDLPIRSGDIERAATDCLAELYS